MMKLLNKTKKYIMLIMVIVAASFVVIGNRNSKKVDAANSVSGGYIYFDNSVTNWSDSYIYFVIGHSSYSSLYQMTKISNTNTYYCKMDKWDGSTYYAVIGTSSSWGSGSWGSSNLTNANHRTAAYTSTYGLNSGSYYSFTPSSSSNGCALSISYLGTSYSSVNKSTYKIYTTLNGTESTAPGTITASAYKLSATSTAGTKVSASVSSYTYTLSSVAVAPIITLTASVNPGYKFEGWYTAASGGTQLSTSTSYSYTGSTKEIYARFQPITYTVAYNSNKPSGASTNMSGSTASSSHTYGTAKALTTNGFILPGYTFAGWNTNSAGSGTNYADKASVSNLTTTNGATVNLYAKWTANTYTVAYNSNKPNGASTSISGSTATSSHTYDEEKALNTNGFILPGYQFAGWAESSSGEVSYTNGQPVSNLTTKNGGTVNLYAKWEAETYTITFDFDGGSSGTASLPVTFDGAVPSITKPTRTGYTFAGYYTSKQDPNLEDPNNAVGTKYFDLNGQFVLSGTWTNASNITLYACWIPESVTVIYNAMGGVSISNDVVKVPGTITFKTTTKEGYQFAGWYFDQALTESAGLSYQAIEEETINLYAKWTPNTYSVIYNGNKPNDASSVLSGSTASSSHTYDEAKALNPNGFILPGYQFAGWAESSSGAVSYSDNESVLNLTSTNGGSVTLYAKWTPNIYTVSFNANGGSGTMSSQQFTYDVYQNLSVSKFSKVGHHVAGWALSSNGDILYLDNASVRNLTTSLSITLYAVWEPNIYTVTFNATGGDGVMTPQKFTYGIPQAISLNEFTETGYTFTGWSLTLGGSQAYENGEEISVEKDMTLYAVWRENVYYVDFNANGGSGSMARIRLTYTDDPDDTDTLPINKFNRVGYKFLGWSKNQNAVSPSYTDQDEVRNLSSIDESVVTLYAVWEAITYKIIYHSNDHQQEFIVFEYTYDETYNIKGFNECDFTGDPKLIFELWSTSKDNSTGISYDALEQFSNMADEQDEEVHLYAIYQNNTTEDAIFIRFMAGMEEINSYYSTPNQQLTNIPDMSQYVFNGWIDNNDVYYPIDATLTPNNDIIYYAIFVSDLTSQIRSTIEFNYRQVYTGSGASKNDVFFVDTYGWDLDPSSVDIYCYVDGDTGYQMTYAGKNEDNKNVYKYTLDDLSSGHSVYFGCGSHKTSAVDVNYVTQYSVSSKTKYIYYSADSSWGTVYCYAWNKDTNQENGAFPGKAMTYVYTNTYGQKVCRYEIGSTDFDMVIFTNGSGSQSSDISISDLTNDNNGFYGLSGDRWNPTTSNDSLADDTISSLVKDSGEDLFKGEQLINFGSVKLYTGLICNSGTVNDAIKSSHEITKIGFFYKEVGKDQEYKPLTHYQSYNDNISSKSQCTSYIDYVKKMNADLDVTYKTQYTIALFVVLDVNGEEIELNVGEKTISVQEIVEIYQGMLGDLISSHEEAFNILGAK